MHQICYVIFVLLSSISSYVHCYNVDDNYPVLFSRPKDQFYGDQTYFGLSLAIHTDPVTNRTSYLIGAPRSNSYSLAGAPATGSVFSCKVDVSDNARCEEVNVERNQPRPVVDDRYATTWKPMKQMGLGTTVIDRPGGRESFLCAPSWAFDRQETYDHEYFPTGMCYKYESERMVSTKIFPMADKDKKFTQKGKNGIYYYSHAQAGLSAVWTDDGEQLFMGAPGFENWVGTVLEYNYSKGFGLGQEIVYDEFDQHAQHANQLPTHEAYTGYSVSVGNFAGIGQAVVAGAPRDSYRGGVFIIPTEPDPVSGRRRRYKLAPPKSERYTFGSYFGAATLAMDINQDGDYDLLVGAPLNPGTYDETFSDRGAVYVYTSRAIGDFPLGDHDNELAPDANQVLRGSNALEARFGTSLANLGDLDQDGYLDLGVGAPYEDEGKGAIYIYYGHVHTDFIGFDSEAVQRIAASSNLAALNLRGFGVTISGNRDIDRNHFPDLVVGSYLSESAVLLRSRPVATVDAQLLFSVKKINTEFKSCQEVNSFGHITPVSCFDVEYCFKYNSKIPGDKQTLSITLRLDTLLEERNTLGLRAYFSESGMSQESVSLSRVDITAGEEEPTCRIKTVFIKNNIQNVLDEMRLKLTYVLLTPAGKFCSHCPIIRNRKEVIKAIPFEMGCGMDNECYSEFGLSAAAFVPQVIASPTGSGPAHHDLVKISSFHIGVYRELVIQVNVTNWGENAFDTKLSIAYPRQDGIALKTLDPFCTESRDFSSTPTSGAAGRAGAGSFLTCDAGQRMKMHELHTFTVIFDLTALRYNVTELRFSFQVETKSEQTANSKNSAILLLGVQRASGIRILGSVISSGHVYEHASRREPDESDLVRASVALTLTKQKPSPVNQVKVFIHIPTLTNSKIKQIPHISYENNGPVRCEGIRRGALELDVNGGWPQGKIGPGFGPSRSGQKPGNEIRPNYERRKREVDSEYRETNDIVIKEGVHLLNRRTSMCEVYQCLAGPFAAGGGQLTTIRLHMALNITTLESELGANFSSVALAVQAQAEILDRPFEGLETDRRDDTEAIVLFRQVPHVLTVPHWVLYAAAAVGILLLVIIILVLIKVGFFRRKAKEELEEAIHQEELGQELEAASQRQPLKTTNHN